jgi:hypothetical protein
LFAFANQRVRLDEASSIQSELPLVSCSELAISVRRNLQPAIFTDIESILLEGRYQGLLVTLAEADYHFLLDIAMAFSKQTPINDPALNAVIDQIAAVVKEQKASAAASTANTAITPPTVKLSEMTPQFESTASMSVKFVIDSIRLYLYEKVFKITISIKIVM